MLLNSLTHVRGKAVVFPEPNNPNKNPAKDSAGILQDPS